MPKPNHKEALLDAGLAAFHRRGYHATGVQEIVSSAGVPKGSFYSHFESKDALGLAALARYWEDRAKARALLRDASLPGLERLDRSFAALGYSEDGCLIGNFTAELAQLDAFRQDLSRLWRQWTDALSQCLASGWAARRQRANRRARRRTRAHGSGALGRRCAFSEGRARPQAAQHSAPHAAAFAGAVTHSPRTAPVLAPETTSPKYNERDRTQTKTPQNQRSWSISTRS
jgi:TetR/AcrR family transcriptional repressor of nem operon